MLQRHESNANAKAMTCIIFDVSINRMELRYEKSRPRKIINRISDNF